MVRLAGGIAPTVHLARQPDDLARVLAGDQYALAHRHTVERTPVQVQAQLIKIERRGSLVLRFENRRAVGAADEQVDPALEVDAAIVRTSRDTQRTSGSARSFAASCSTRLFSGSWRGGLGGSTFARKKA